MVDDVAFAQFWKDNRESFRPRSQWLTRQELRRKGVTTEVIDEVLAGLDDADSAYRAASAKARSLRQSEYPNFHRRLGDYLRRRGFGYGVIQRTVKRLWQERDLGNVNLENELESSPVTEVEGGGENGN